MISQLGRYEILGELGHGAMGIVYKAKDPLIDRVVAIKTINLGLALDEKEEYEERFYQEAKAAGRLSHPNIVTIYDVGKSNDVAYIAMELLQGRELRDMMDESGLMPVEQVMDITAQVAQGLAYAHEHDIIHRDVKPSNIMVVRDGHVKITDFGIARMASSAVRTQTGMVLGSPKYMSPEQVMGKTIDNRSDIFSLGVMLYEMLTGLAPFVGENVNAIMYQTLNVTPTAPSKLNPTVPEMLNFIVAKALAKGLEDRYQNAKDFAIDLRACRDTMHRSVLKTDVLKPMADKGTLAEPLGMTGQMVASEDGDISATPVGLSPAFDSSAATMRLAALTANKDADELSKALKVPPPNTEMPPKLAATPKASRPVVSPQVLHVADHSNSAGSLIKPKKGNLFLIVLLAMILLAIASFIVF